MKNTKLKWWLIHTVVLSVSCFMSNAAMAVLYTAKVAEVSVRSADGVETLYIRLDGNPNPASCGNTFAGANWSLTGKSMNMALAVALTAKATGSVVRADISETNCGNSNWPQMEWLQIQ